MTAIKTHAPFIALALITITLSSWGLFRLLVDFAACPPWFAVLAVGGADLLAVVCGKQAIDVAGDGDSPAFWNAAMLLITGVAAWLQFAHTQLAGQPLAIGVIMAVFPVATVLLFEGRLRRAARLNGRKQGLVAPPRATIPLLVWVHFPVDSWRANRQAIRAQGHLDAEIRPAPAIHAIDPAGGIQPWTPSDSHRQQVAKAAEQVADALMTTPDKRPVRAKPAGQSVAASAAAAASRMDTRDVDTVWEEVRRTTHPDAKKEAVRKGLSRIPTNGHVHA